jgi:hypothetical protein
MITPDFYDPVKNNDVIASAHGPPLLQQLNSATLRQHILGLTFRRQANKKTNLCRVIAQQDQFGFGEAEKATAGGKAIAAALVSFVRDDLLEGYQKQVSVMRLWSPAYVKDSG